MAKCWGSAAADLIAPVLSFSSCPWPAAAATLYVKDGIGYLADAATDPKFRRHGLQSALLRRRICDAAAADAGVVFSGATPFSTSHRNMERAGMRVHFVRSLWTPV